MYMYNYCYAIYVCSVQPLFVYEMSDMSTPAECVAFTYFKLSVLKHTKVRCQASLITNANIIM